MGRFVGKAVTEMPPLSGRLALLKVPMVLGFGGKPKSEVEVGAMAYRMAGLIAVGLPLVKEAVMMPGGLLYALPVVAISSWL